MREFETLTEKRRNPEVNTKQSALAALKKYAGQDDVFVSFTDDVGTASHGRKNEFTPNASGAKLGINPQTPYATPVGIYAYPIDYVLENQMDVPFAKNKPFLWVIRANNMSQMLDLDRITNEQREAIIDECPDFDESRAGIKAFVKSKGGVLWSLMHMQSLFNAKEALAATGKYDRHPRIWDDEEEQWVDDLDDVEADIPEEIMEQRAAKEWANILRRAGIVGVIDDGAGIIHSNEPTQAFFLDRSALRELEVIRNIKPRSEMTRDDLYRQKGHVLIRDIQNGRLSEAEMLRVLSFARPFRYMPLTEPSDAIEQAAALIRRLPASVQNLLLDNAEQMLDPRLLEFIPLSDDRALNMLRQRPSFVANMKMTPAIRNYIADNFEDFVNVYHLPLDDDTVAGLFNQHRKLLLNKILRKDQVSVAVQKLAVKLFPDEALRWLNCYWVEDEVFLALFKRVATKMDVFTITMVLKTKLRSIHNHTDFDALQELITLCLLIIPPRKSRAVADFFEHGEPRKIMDDPRIRAKWGSILPEP